MPIAVVGPPTDGAFVVQFLVKEDAGDPVVNKVLEDVRGQLDVYLLEVGGPNAWAYAHYHCTTASNAYSRVHWGSRRARVENFAPADHVIDEAWNEALAYLRDRWVAELRGR